MESIGNLSSETRLKPIIGSKEFPPLSLRPIVPGYKSRSVSLPGEFVLDEQTRENKCEKNLDDFLPESENIINSGLHQARHTQAMSAELKLILENEKKILDQIMKRCAKFVELKDENKQKTEEWHTEVQKRLTKYDSYLTKLSNPTDDLNVDEDDIKSQVQEKVLFEIVHKTSEAAKDISVQLSIEETIINDVLLSLTDLKKHGAVMLRLVAGWTRMLGCHGLQQEEIVKRWRKVSKSLKDLEDKSKSLYESADGLSSAQIQSLVNHYDSRLRRLEEACEQLPCSCEQCEQPSDMC